MRCTPYFRTPSPQPNRVPFLKHCIAFDTSFMRHYLYSSVQAGTSRLLWRRGRVFASHAEGRGFDPQSGQKGISIFSPVTSGAQRK